MSKRNLAVVALLLLLAVLAVGCAQDATPPPAPVATPLPAIEINPTSGSIKASGEIVPAQQSRPGFPTAGRVQNIAVAEGDLVQADDLLMTLDDATAAANVAQAEATLLRTQALLAELQAGPREQEIAVAQARLDMAEAHLQQLDDGARPDELAAAEAELAAAEAAQRQLYSGPTAANRAIAQAALSSAEAARDQAQAAYDDVAWHSNIGQLPQSLALQEATNNYNAAKARYDALFVRPTADVVAAAKARIQQAQAALDRMQAPATTGQLAEAQAQVRSAEAELELLQAGVRTESVAVAEAAMAEAEAALQRTLADLANTELRAPASGVVAALDVNPGELVLPGQAALTLADLDHLQVETTDLSERDVARVKQGQAVTIYVEALNTDLPGRVLRIAPQASVIGGDVVYTVVIALDEQPADLRWGMSVDVEISDG